LNITRFWISVLETECRKCSRRPARGRPSPRRCCPRRRLVVDDDLLAGRLLDVLAKGAGDAVGQAAGREVDDDGDRLGRPGALRAHDRGRGQNQADAGAQNSTPCSRLVLHRPHSLPISLWAAMHSG
jgi:hypothetical protein